MKVKAAFVEEEGHPYKITELDLAEVGPTDVLVKMVASGLCRSDHAERNGNALPFPAVLGHEGSGIIETVGSSVTSVKPGDHVILSYAYCGRCRECAAGHPSSCIKWFDLNVSGKNAQGKHVLQTKDKRAVNTFFNQSSFATHSLTDESNVVKVDKQFDLRLLGPLGCGLGTGSGTVLNVLHPQVGDSIAIFGTGAVGFSAIMAAKMAGCDPIIAIDIVPGRLDLALKIGATHIINGKEEDAEKMIQELTTDGGVDVAIDTTGVVPVMRQALQSIKNQGTFAPLAVTKEPFELNTFFDLVFGNKRIQGALIGNTIPKFHLPSLLSLYSEGRFPFDKFVKFYDFEDINQAEEDALRGDVVKPVVVIDPTYKAPAMA